jgi:uncharacterized repeat protein (TIGR01451 family)
MNRFFSTLNFLLFSAAALVSTGCQTADPQETTVASEATSTQAKVEQAQLTVIEATPAPVVDKTENILKTHQIKVTKTLIEAAPVGGVIRYQINIEALEKVGPVRITETMPDGIEFKSATPGAKRSGSNVTWIFPSIDKGQTLSIDVAVKPLAEGDHRILSAVSVENRLMMDLFSGQPELAIKKQGPESVELGDIATWRVTVTNNGSANARNIIITDKLPEAFEPTKQLRYTIDTLAPGEARTVKYSAKAVTQGNFENHAIASYEGGPVDSVESKLPVKVVQSGIRVRKMGPEEAFVLKPEVFKITIENTGDTDLKNIRITDILPEGSFVADNGLGRVSGNAIGWMIPLLPVGSSQLITTEIAATRKGESVNTVKVVTGNGIQTSDSTSTKWLAVPGVSVSISDNKDPIRVKERTTYNIQVNNQGKFEPVSGTITVTFNKSIKPISITGDTQGKIDGQTVTFPRTTLEPGKDIYLSIIAEGAEIGPGRAVMNFSADFLSDPILSEETTNVY